MDIEENVIYVKAKTINEVRNISVKTINDVKSVGAYSDKTHIYEQQAENHANTAKHYADVAMQYAENSKEAEIWAEGTDEEVQALGGEHSAKTWAELLAEGTGGKWGTIIGDITEQYDLMEQLDSKANTSYVEELVEGFESSLGDKVSTKNFNTAVGSFNEAISLKQDILTAGENITIVDNVISAEDGINNKVTNCILAMPEITYSGNTFTIKAGTKALAPNGYNEDRTFNNVEWTAQNDIIQTVDLYNDSTHLVYRPDVNYLVHSNFLGSFAEAPALGGSWGTYYNTTENRYYISGVAEWAQEPLVFLAELTATDGVITSFKPKEPVKLVTFDDIKEIKEEISNNKSEWVKCDIELLNVSVSADSTYSIDLSDILPEGNQFEISMSVSNSNTMGFLVLTKIDNEILPNVLSKTGRTLTITIDKVATTSVSSTIVVKLMAYKKL